MQNIFLFIILKINNFHDRKGIFKISKMMQDEPMIQDSMKAFRKVNLSKISYKLKIIFVHFLKNLHAFNETRTLVVSIGHWFIFECICFTYMFH